MIIEIICKNEDCQCKFKVDTSDFEVQSEPSGNHTTQYLETGEANCPSCGHEMDIEYLYDALDDTDEILSSEIKVR